LLLGSEETPGDNALARFLNTLPGTWDNADLNVDNFVNSWLQEGQPTTGENALALAFSTHETPSIDDFNFFSTGPYSSFFDSNIPLAPPALEPVGVVQPPHPMPIFQASPSVRPAASLDVDTWQSDLNKEDGGSGNVDGEGQLITSPDQVLDGLHLEEGEETAAIDRRFIPSMAFLDTCVHLYFRDFHPSFPILHKATFSRHTATPLLLLSICSIGSMFVGTQAAREKCLWIYAKLHYVIVFGISCPGSRRISNRFLSLSTARQENVYAKGTYIRYA
jgi:hypothetical protein